MGRSGGRKQQQKQQQHGAGRKSRRVSAVLNVCLTCLKVEEWCFAVGEVGHVAPDQHPPWQVREDCPEQELEDEEAERPQPKVSPAGKE
ncbi:UNVERIFIED_CONTAM: hypothetical protein FKN15_073141 [Acipenser sinensis]